MSTFYILSQISAGSAVLPLIFGVVLYRHLSTNFKWLLLLIIISFVLDMISTYLNSVGSSTLPAVHLFFILQLPLIQMIYQTSKSYNLILKSIAWIITGIALICLLVIMWGSWLNESMILPVPIISTLTVISVSLIYIVDRVVNIDINERLFTSSLLVFAFLLLYNCSIISIFTLYKTLITDIYIFKLVVYIFFNLAVAFIFYRQRSHGKYTS